MENTNLTVIEITQEELSAKKQFKYNAKTKNAFVKALATKFIAPFKKEYAQGKISGLCDNVITIPTNYVDKHSGLQIATEITVKQVFIKEEVSEKKPTEEEESKQFNASEMF